MDESCHLCDMSCHTWRRSWLGRAAIIHVTHEWMSYVTRVTELCLTSLYLYIYIYIYIYLRFGRTGWRRLVGSPEMRFIFHKRANKYRSLLRKMTCKDKGSYEFRHPIPHDRSCEMHLASNHIQIRGSLLEYDWIVGVVCESLWERVACLVWVYVRFSLWEYDLFVGVVCESLWEFVGACERLWEFVGESCVISSGIRSEVVYESRIHILHL